MRRVETNLVCPLDGEPLFATVYESEPSLGYHAEAEGPECPGDHSNQPEYLRHAALLFMERIEQEPDFQQWAVGTGQHIDVRA